MTTAIEINNAPSALIWENLNALHLAFEVVLMGSAAAEQTEILELVERIRPIVRTKNTTKARAFFVANRDLWED